MKISAKFASGSTPVAASGNCVLDKEVAVIAHACPTYLETSVLPSKWVILTIPVSIRGVALLGIVDTVAQVTVIKKSFYASLKVFVLALQQIFVGQVGVVPFHYGGQGSSHSKLENKLFFKMLSSHKYLMILFWVWIF